MARGKIESSALFFEEDHNGKSGKSVVASVYFEATTWPTITTISTTTTIRETSRVIAY
jgi:hypothetical protein